MAAPATFSLYRPKGRSSSLYLCGPTHLDMFSKRMILTCAFSGISFTSS